MLCPESGDGYDVANINQNQDKYTFELFKFI